MGYSVFKFGALYLNDKVQPVPKWLTNNGDIPSYDGKTTISFGLAGKEESVTWIKPDSLNLLVADHVLLVNVSWEDLDKNGFVAGKTVLLDGQCFRCRLLQVGEKKDVPNEWDKILDATNTNNAFWHWKAVHFWGADISVYNASNRMALGYYSAHHLNHYNATTRSVFLGFRPALEFLPSDAPTPNINLDGVGFQLTSLPGGDDFCPILQPIQEDVFKDIPVESKVRMYTLTEDGRPVHMGKPVKDPSKLILTDRYYGDEYLVSWIVSNGVAVASQSVPQQAKKKG